MNTELKDILIKNWKQIVILTIIIFLVANVISFLFPFQTKIQNYVGIPLAFYGYGVFPWLGDLEDKTIFSLTKLLVDIIFWFIISVLIYRFASKGER